MNEFEAYALKLPVNREIRCSCLVCLRATKNCMKTTRLLIRVRMVQTWKTMAR